MKSRTPLSFSTIPSAKEVAQDPLGALVICREARRSFEASSRKHYAKMYRVCFIAAVEMDRDFQKWKTFVREANQMKVMKRKVRRDKDAPDKLIIVSRFVFGWSHSYDRAWKISRALRFVALTTSDPAELMAQLELNNGIEGLYKTAVETIPHKGRTAGQISAMEAAYRRGDTRRLELLRGTSGNPLDELALGLDDGKGLDDPAAIGTEPAALAPLQSNDLVIETTSEQLHALLSGKRRRHRLLIKRVGPSTETWKRFKLVRWKALPKSPRKPDENLR
ncbi:hypothetical protein EN932_10390 [Mesorhizobium sp. M7A.F.Ca.US.002.01.1.1]|uniref:hypothetical protein n=1 Tax=Mesorhizobium sp. M7A.F.Ca.US.002.01.1.1 TaxID=2496700 RepID=UPI000FD4EBC5|nr:hypothetical protein [Mesorhizobium sp. M7A.F.Ca.US.002.01.1.1]RVA12945.1 hypothetical protein EN932_10390 [Mesorhizobium sp. M7A.F.Ca.US.002.01.1.1]